MIRHLILFLCTTAIFSCTQNYNGPCDDTIVESIDAFENGPFDSSTEINSIAWNGTCLDFSISYGGGCGEHDINIVTDGSIIKTDPPIIQLKLQHDNTDQCEAIITETISFDLGENTFLNEYDEIILDFANPEFDFTLVK